MAHKRTQSQILSNVRLDGRYIEETLPSSSPNTDGLLVTDKAAPVSIVQARATNFAMPIVDSGGANGGNYAGKIITMPASQIYVVQTHVFLEVLSVTGGIAATATVTLASGSTAGVGALTGTEVDYSAAAGAALVGGAGTLNSQSTIIGVQFDGTGGLDWYLNVNVADAGITADGTLVCNVLARTFFLDMSRGN